MAPKGHRPQVQGGPPLRHHHRTSSGGSSKIALHLQITQKDLPVHKHLEKTKKSAITHEAHARNRDTSPFPRPHHHHLHPDGITHRTHSSELLPTTTKRTTTTTTTHKHNGLKTKADFTLASPGTDEEEWISSESGAVTPSHPQSDHDDADPEGGDTPVEDVSRVDTVRVAINDLAPPVPPPAPQLRPHIKRSSTRPPSTHSLGARIDMSTALRPHPLIRGHSFGQTAPLAPLTVTSDTPITASPTLCGSDRDRELGYRLSSSPDHIMVPGSPASLNSSSLRRTSVSSTRSAATLPVPSTSPSKDPHKHTNNDRHRTLSTNSPNPLSTNHILHSPALTSLTHLPVYSRPVTPQTVSYFPVPNPHINLEAIHPLLPAPYLNTHLTVLAYRSPMRESFDRVMQAKLAR